MQKLKLLLIAPWILFLNGCKDQFPTIEPQVRCVNVLLEKKSIEGIPFYTGYCRCHNYEWTIERIGRVGNSIDYSMEKCDRLVGFEPDTYEKIYMWWEEIRLWLKRRK